eukprot:6197038-Pleurochrysis_carterae.AAC.1
MEANPAALRVAARSKSRGAGNACCVGCIIHDRKAPILLHHAGGGTSVSANEKYWKDEGGAKAGAWKCWKDQKLMVCAAGNASNQLTAFS